MGMAYELLIPEAKNAISYDVFLYRNVTYGYLRPLNSSVL